VAPLALILEVVGVLEEDDDGGEVGDHAPNDEHHVERAVGHRADVYRIVGVLVDDGEDVVEDVDDRENKQEVHPEAVAVHLETGRQSQDVAGLQAEGRGHVHDVLDCQEGVARGRVGGEEALPDGDIAEDHGAGDGEKKEHRESRVGPQDLPGLDIGEDKAPDEERDSVDERSVVAHRVHDIFKKNRGERGGEEVGRIQDASRKIFAD